MPEAARVPLRSEVAAADTWDLSSLYPSAEAWESALAELESLIPRIAGLKETR